MEIEEKKLKNVLENSTPPKKNFFLPVIILVIFLGVLTGYFLSRRETSLEVSSGGTGIIAPGAIKAGQEFGSKTQVFKDTTLGIIEKGGIDGEGTHKLVREGGPSQTAYITSSVLDLDQFIGKKVQVWGETLKGQKASWLMDVGRVKILE